MNRQEFRLAAQAFVKWAGKFQCGPDGHMTPVGPGALRALSINLAIPKSAYVPAAIHRRVPFFQLTDAYSWRATGMTDGSFAETRAKLKDLSKRIGLASNDAEAITACKDILHWGGDRTPKVGAFPFLHCLEKKGGLLDYLNAVKSDLALQTAVLPTAGELSAVMKMNSMLTKIHAFYSGDGLPIYDSRVAGAIATVVETWRREVGLSEEQLPAALLFPEVGGGGPRRSLLSRYPESIKPAVLYYVNASQSPDRAIRTAKEWASAKVRLGWLLSELQVEPSTSGIRSLEACLFMAGYDCASINS